MTRATEPYADSRETGPPMRQWNARLLDSPSNRMEASGYLWEGWTYLVGNVEKEPWQVWIQGWESQ